MGAATNRLPDHLLSFALDKWANGGYDLALSRLFGESVIATFVLVHHSLNRDC